MKIAFLKMEGSGNDFMVIDNRNQSFSALPIPLIKKWCDRKKGIGADGLILIESSSCSDFKMRIFNSDGTEASMCGNGARCAVHFAHLNKIIDKTQCSLETLAGIIHAKIIHDHVQLNMGIPKKIQTNVSLTCLGKNYKIHSIDTGVPHIVIFMENIDLIDVGLLGKAFRHHDFFKPHGTNCDFVQILDLHTIKVRTYERGVEDETLSCGTGVCASAIVSVLLEKAMWPIQALTQTGEILTIDSTLTPNQLEKVFFLTGPVSVCFSGEIAHPIDIGS